MAGYYLGGMRALLGLPNQLGQLFDDATALAGNTFFDVGASGAQILANPNAYVRAVASGIMDNDHRLSKEWLALRDQRRNMLPRYEYSDQGKDMGASVAGVAGDAWDAYAEKYPNAAQTVAEYATSPTMGAVMAGVESVAAPASQLGKRGAAYIAADVGRRQAAPTLGEALFETLAPQGLPAGGQTGIFAGRQAISNLAESGKTVRTSHGVLGAEDLYSNLNLAKGLAKEGVSPDAIWTNTGWFQGADDQWRFEIDDSEARTRGPDEPKVNRSRAWVGEDVLEHPDRTAAYPQVAGIMNRADNTFGGGSYQQDQNVIINNNPRTPDNPDSFRPPGAFRSIQLHEEQHAIQSLEGMNRGANAQGLSTRATDRFMQGLDEWNDIMLQAGYDPDKLITRSGVAGYNSGDDLAMDLEMQAGWLMDRTGRTEPEVEALMDDVFGGNVRLAVTSPYSDYFRSAGEVEARNVQARRDMTPQERAEIPPMETESVPRRDQWVDLKGGGTPQSVPDPRGAPLEETLGGGVRRATVMNRPPSEAGSKTTGTGSRTAPAPDRDAIWSSQQATAARIRGQRNKRTGVYLGAPQHINTPQKKAGLVTRYANRIERAIKNGIAPGYFYREGRESLAEISEPGQGVVNAQTTGVTSSQVGPKDNMNYFAKGAEQRAMLGPQGVSTTIYPNKSQSEFLTTLGMGKETPWLGHKRERYSNLLIPERDLPADMPEGSMMAPNDRWEGRAAGFPGPPSGELQVAWVDEIRELALDRVNARRAARGERPLTIEEAQELHWAQIRADSENRRPDIRPEDTIGGALDRLMYQHSWESMPGKTSGHMPEVGQTMSPVEYHREIKPMLIGDDGKDRLVRAMGSEYQRPAFDAPGEFQGQFSPGVQSQSLVSQTASGGLLPQSQARVQGTEAVRSFLLAQDADAGSAFSPITKPGQRFNAVAFNMGRTTSKKDMKAVQKILRGHFGLKASEDIVVVPSANGIRIFHPFGTRAFEKGMNSVNDRLREVTGVDGVKGLTESHYNELGWKQGTATRDMLKILDNPDAPLLLKHATSKQMRALVGGFADKYEQLRKAGLSPNDQLIDVLKAWRDGGLWAVREMVQKGLAPAVAVTILAQRPADES